MPKRTALVLAAAAALLLASSAGATSQAGPVSVSAPVVAGVTRVGSTLTGSPGSWTGTGTISYAYAWQRCDATGGGCAAVSSATGGTFPLTTADSGKTVALTVTATDSTGAATRASSLIGPIAATGLASSVRPTIAGAATAGVTLTVSAGTWTAVPTSLAYSWLRCDATGRTCVAAAGATTSSYLVTAADAGHVLVASVTATAGTASQSVLSLESAPVAGGATVTGLGRPAISGFARVGQRLSSVPPTGTAVGATLAYQWYRCDPTGAHCSSVHGAVGKTYTAVGKDAGQTVALTVRVSAAGATASTYSSLIGPFAPATAKFVSTVQPTVTGQAVQGQTLTAAPGTWSTTPTAVRYAWQRCNANGRICIPIDGATAATYVPATADVGHALVALVLAGFGTTTQTTLSTATDPILASVLGNTAPPTVAGTLKAGQKLTGSAGTWTGTAPITYHYQWYRCDGTGSHCLSVHGATALTYTLVAKDVGQTIGLTVTATDATGSKPAYASLVGPVAAATATLASTVRPVVTAQAGQLAVDAGTWTATPTATTFQWERCNANGRICVPIAGATTAAYTEGADDTGHALVAVVTATAGGVTAATFSQAALP